MGLSLHGLIQRLHGRPHMKPAHDFYTPQSCGHRYGFDLRVRAWDFTCKREWGNRGIHHALDVSVKCFPNLASLWRQENFVLYFEGFFFKKNATNASSASTKNGCITKKHCAWRSGMIFYLGNKIFNCWPKFYYSCRQVCDIRFMDGSLTDIGCLNYLGFIGFIKN